MLACWPIFVKTLQARRDGEVQLHPLEQREADLAEELHRQKEKERLRKEYIEELKKRHEEEKNRLEALHLKEQAGRRDDQVVDSRALHWKEHLSCAVSLLCGT